MSRTSSAASTLSMIPREKDVVDTELTGRFVVLMNFYTVVVYTEPDIRYRKRYTLPHHELYT